MTAAPLRKDNFDVDHEVAPPKDAAAAVKAGPRRPGLPFGIKLPAPRVLFDDTWPPVVGIVGFLLLWSLLAPMMRRARGSWQLESRLGLVMLIAFAASWRGCRTDFDPFVPEATSRLRTLWVLWRASRTKELGG